MATSSITGLATGLDTAAIIDQLMAIEAVPQAKLKTKVSTTQSVITALQTLNTKVSVLGSKAEALAKASAWTPVKATSSNAGVTVTAGPSAQPTSLALTVVNTAASHQLSSQAEYRLTDVVSGSPLTIEHDDGTTVEIVSDGTLKGVVAAINAKSDAGVRATAVKVGGEGETARYRLLLESTSTGAASRFELGAGGTPLAGFDERVGKDAQISLSTAGGPLTITSPSNTFDGLVDGLTVTLGDQAAGEAKVSLTRDTASMVAQVQGLVDALNAALDEIGTQTAYNAETRAAGRLLGDSAVRSLRDSLLNSIYPSDGTSMASVGIQTTREGRLTFDAAVFTAAYNADPAGVADRFTAAGDGFAARVEKVATLASDSTTGSISAAITGRKSEVKQLTESIDAWDLRLELRRTTLQRQYTALETAMSRMSSQSDWLSAQIEALKPAKG